VISPISVHFWWWDNKTNMDCLFWSNFGLGQYDITTVQ